MQHILHTCIQLTARLEIEGVVCHQSIIPSRLRAHAHCSIRAGEELQELTGGDGDGTTGEGTVAAAGVISAAARGKTLAADTASEAARPPKDTHSPFNAGLHWPQECSETYTAAFLLIAFNFHPQHDAVTCTGRSHSAWRAAHFKIWESLSNHGIHVRNPIHLGVIRKDA